ncbi:hypothetical protein FT663_01113 [Candidozyma haemuli var. vulneris]|uniref:PI31 proteasome regulator C-terminal domain-containing protein n=1 Tax=Candidozyma haemuli TaxID=45357 RepID=A0A2V1AWI9_9ASCO|nr:hypothetical protein CXQ85_004842 [[Candida] haemuloni]KAF3993700.1 hypothetical protein FT662_00413 [[Candida] haemuloni var. vulneris]KAF3994757.1 hypothetical protein FT663_01113 [[Candida] haemuloni var. vulneris]PVH22172.1 hypothetical protein CXQ85_004842 [[Candida] haemuloni]
MANTYYELTLQLLKAYIAERYEAQVNVKVDTPEFNKWEAGPFIVTVSEISPNNSLINFVRGSQSVSVSIEWEKWNIELPVKEVSDELKQQFAVFLDTRLDPPKLRRDEEHKDSESLTGPPPPGPPGLGIPRASDDDLNAIGSRKPADMPDFEDEYEVLGSANRTGTSSTFAPIGDRDLNPPGLSRDPPMKPFIDPLAAPEGGMHPTMDHPLFGRSQGNASRRGVPPGARFDDPMGEDNLEDMGMGLPGNLRRGGGPGFGPGGPGGPGFGPGGSSGFGGGFGGGFGF